MTTTLPDPKLTSPAENRRLRIVKKIDDAICVQQESTRDGGDALQTVQKFMEALLRQSQILNTSMLNYLRELVEHAPTIDEWDTIFKTIDKEKHPQIHAMMLDRRRHIDQFWISAEAMVYGHGISLAGLDPAKDLLPDELHAMLSGQNKMP